MNLSYRKSNELTADARKIREAVFMQEQGFEHEFDAIDEYAGHIVFYDGDNPIAVCRYYMEDSDEGDYTIGRVAVMKEYRGRHIGGYMMQVLEETIRSEHGKTISLSAQTEARSFYEKSGYTADGECYFDEHCEHILMKKVLK